KGRTRKRGPGGGGEPGEEGDDGAPRQHRQARRERRIALDAGEEEGQKQEQPAQRHVEEEGYGVHADEGADVEELRRHQRRRGPAFDEGEADEQRHARGRGRERGHRRRRARGADAARGQGAEAGGGEDGAGDGERAAGRLGTVGRHAGQRQDEERRGQRHIDDEDPAPARVVDEPAADEGPGGGGQGGRPRPRADGAAARRARIG